MAWLTKRGDFFHIEFKHGARHFSRSLKTKDLRKADGLRIRLEDNLAEVERGRLDLPAGCDPISFLLSDGKVDHKILVKKEMTLAHLFERYQKEVPIGAKESSTRQTEDTHIEHLKRLIGESIYLGAISTETVQKYIIARSQEIGLHNMPVSHVTIRKEVSTLATIWNRWAYPLGLVTIPAPTRNLLFQKTKTKAPFQTLEQIQRQIERQSLSEAQQRDLWDSVYLPLPDMELLLRHVKSDKRPFVYPFFVFAAHTGARRSEIRRSQIEDFDFANQMVRIREKKRDSSKLLTYRHIPISALMAEVMEGWLKSHPGGSYAICDERGNELTKHLATYYFKRALARTKWAKLTGWHVLRHSFASNCAAKGIDQRMIDEWMGHQTEEMRRRYRHLFPHQQQAALKLVFG